MARSMWSGTVSFGMVSVPVKMYKGTEKATDGLRLVCRCHQQAIDASRRCATTGDRLQPFDVIKGASVDVGVGPDLSAERFVTIDESDLDALPLRTLHTVDIQTFVPRDTVPFHTHGKELYYLAPDYGTARRDQDKAQAAKPYTLLRAALTKSGTVAIGRVGMREREQLCAVGVEGDTITLTTLLWPALVRNTADLPIPEQEPAPGEVKLALSLVDALAGEWEPESYQDAYAPALHDLIEQKKAGKKPSAPLKPVKDATDLLDALKASVAAASAKPKRSGKGKRAA